MFLETVKQLHTIVIHLVFFFIEMVIHLVENMNTKKVRV